MDRTAGRIADWNEAKGYGFVTPHDGGARAFLHVKAFQSGSRRPVDGDLVSYAIRQDGRGRLNAVDVRFAGQRIEARRPPAPRRRPRPVPRVVLGIVALLAVAALAAVEQLPVPFALGYLGLSGLSYMLYTLDKHAAGKGHQRIPEATLHAVDALGGWPGALIAQQQARHKVSKASFQALFWVTVLANIALVGWLVRSERARAMGEVLSGG